MNRLFALLFLMLAYVSCTDKEWKERNFVRSQHRDPSLIGEWKIQVKPENYNFSYEFGGRKYSTVYYTTGDMFLSPVKIPKKDMPYYTKDGFVIEKRVRGIFHYYKYHMVGDTLFLSFAGKNEKAKNSTETWHQNYSRYYIKFLKVK